MSYKISKGKTEFLRAMSTALDIEAFFKDYAIDTTEMIGVAFIGRSNVGKSSLINALFGKSVARVSKTPGRTQQINLFQFEIKNDQQLTKKFFLFDLPGYGHASVGKNMLRNWQEIIGLFFSLANKSVVFVAIQDARHPGQEVDFLLFKYLAKIRPIIILVLNKIDKLKSQKERAALQKCIPTLSKDFKLARQFYLVSAEKREGLEILENGMMMALGLDN